MVSSRILASAVVRLLARAFQVAVFSLLVLLVSGSHVLVYQTVAWVDMARTEESNGFRWNRLPEAILTADSCEQCQAAQRLAQTNTPEPRDSPSPAPDRHLRYPWSLPPVFTLAAQPVGNAAAKPFRNRSENVDAPGFYEVPSPPPRIGSVNALPRT